MNLMMNDLQRGFTLLEVLVAITLTALVMGSVFSLQSQNSRLAVNAIETIDETVNRRAALNLAWIEVDIFENLAYKVDNEVKLPIPDQLEGKIKDNMLGLESFELLDDKGNVMHTSVRLKKADSL